MSARFFEERLNLPFVGPVSFARSPLCLDLDAINADVAVIGVPNDMASQYRPGCRFGPRAVREASVMFSFGNGLYSHEDDRTYLTEEQVRIQDVGDVDILHTDMARSNGNATEAVRRILARKAMPVILGGDHSVTVPVLAAFEGEPLHVVQIDAHLDFADERCGVRWGNGSPMRRVSEMKHVTGLTQLGIRNVSSSNSGDYADARAFGSDILSVRQFRAMGVEKVLERIPTGKRYYVTFDIDGLDPSLAPGTSTPSCGGFTYDEVIDLYRGLARRGDVVGLDVVEICPVYDPAGITAMHAAQILMTALGFIFYERMLRREKRESVAAQPAAS